MTIQLVKVSSDTFIRKHLIFAVEREGLDVKIKYFKNGRRDYLEVKADVPDHRHFCMMLNREPYFQLVEITTDLWLDPNVVTAIKDQGDAGCVIYCTFDKSAYTPKCHLSAEQVAIKLQS